MFITTNPANHVRDWPNPLPFSSAPFQARSNHLRTPAAISPLARLHQTAHLPGAMNNGLTLLGVPTFYQPMATGIIILLAALMDRVTRGKG